MLLKAPGRPATLCVVLFLACLSGAAQSPTAESGPQAIAPEKRAAIAELLEVTEAKKTATNLFNSILDSSERETPELVWDTISGRKEIQALTPAQREALRKELIEDSAQRNKRMRELFARKIDMATLIDEISYNLYDKYFTDSEIKDLIAFYKSPTGKKSISVMPSLFAESMSRTVASLKPKVAEIMSEFMDEEANRVQHELDSLTKPKPTRPADAKP